jgi:cytosine/adenosine deaminase-related metal-dependent hydrolase
VLTIAGERITAVGSRSTAAEAEDLGNVAILPGLVNAHTHLDFSSLSEPLGEPGMAFVDWILRVIEFRTGEKVTGAFCAKHPSGRSGKRRLSPFPHPVEQGLEESICSGTTTLGEIAQPGWPVRAVDAARLDATVFLELIAPTAERVAPVLPLAQQHLQAANSAAGWRPGLSPHAPYSVHHELLAWVTALCAARRIPLAIHLAESREEMQLLRTGTGPLRDRLVELHAWDPQAIRPGTRPLDYLNTLAAAHRTLIIHGNYLDDEEIAFLAGQAERMSVVHCPRTHAYFGHEAYPLEQMLAAGVTVALGSDSRASAPDLSLLAEMRFVAGRHPQLGRDVVLQLGTINGARALGRDREVGSLAPGKYANLAVVALPDRDAADPHELLFDSEEPVVGTWYRGRMIDD